MDTKLKKTHKLTVGIITLIVLGPAIILTALYPKMEKEYLQKYQDYQEEYENETKNMKQWQIVGNFANYATEASYFLYGDLLEESGTKTDLNYDVLYDHAWDSDYNRVMNSTKYWACYTKEDGETITTQNTENDLGMLADNPSKETLESWKGNGAVGYLTVNFDKYGKPYNIHFTDLTENDLNYATDVYEDVKASINQYENNVRYYNEENYDESYGTEDYPMTDGATETLMEESSATSTVIAGEVDAKELLPKSYRAVFLLDEDSDFVWNISDVQYLYWTSTESIYVDNGVLYIVCMLAVLVALGALLLPFIRSLDTGWERIFSIPLEVNLVLIGLGIAGAYGMFEVMCNSTSVGIAEAISQYGEIKILGYGVNAGILYGMILILNAIGWGALFFMEYVVVANFRQFLCSPRQYIKDKLLIVRFVRWCVKKIRELVDWVTAIDITDHLQKSILKIVAVNFVILTILCSFRFFGLFGLIAYSVVLYILLAKYGEKVRNQYKSVLDATEEMANGNFKITLDEELGVFKPLGEKLEKVNEGFAKAVREEAKSQNMKTELITNVSHDLKTPLTAIITYIDLLKQDNVSEEDRKSYIRTLDQKSQRLKALIEDLFEISKANSGNVKMNFMDVDVVNLMKQVRLELEDKIADSDLTFRWNLPEEKVILKLDGQRTYRVFDNLINNILKYAMPYSRVYIDIVDGEDKVQIIFRNISASELDYNVEHLTERFVRGDVSRNSEGSGLGLAIVKSFVELQNGIFKIEVDGDLFKAIIIWQK